jgi:hypothetical protein
MHFRVLVPAVVAMATMGCATMGRPIDVAQVETLKVGATTREQAVELLGPPTSMSTSSAGITVLAWSHAHAVAFGGATSTMVMLTFGADGRMTNKTVSGANL